MASLSAQAASWCVNAERVSTLVSMWEIGRDHTLFAKVDGLVSFERVGKKRTRVSVQSLSASN